MLFEHSRQFPARVDATRALGNVSCATRCRFHAQPDVDSTLINQGCKFQDANWGWQAKAPRGGPAACLQPYYSHTEPGLDVLGRIEVCYMSLSRR